MQLSAGVYIQEGKVKQLFIPFPTPSISLDATVEITMGTLLGMLVILSLAMLLFDFDQQKGNGKVLKSPSPFSGRTIKSFFDQLLPSELQAESWISTMMLHIEVDHILGIFMSKSLSLPQWMNLLCRSFVLFFVNTLVAAFFYADDGSCGKFSSVSKCNGFRDFFPRVQWKICRWEDYNQSCTYNAQIDNSNIIFTSTFFVLAGSAWIVVLVRLILHDIIYSKMAQKVIPKHLADISVAERDDEFYQKSSLRKIIQRCAGYVLAKERIDKLSMETETANLLSTIQAAVIERHEAPAMKLIMTKSVENVSSEVFLYEKLTNESETARKHVKGSRDETVLYFRKLEKMNTLESKENYLIVKFLLEFMSNNTRSIAERYLLSSTVPHSTVSMNWKVFTAFILMVALGSMAYVTFILLGRIGSESSKLWLLIGFVSIGVDFFILQILTIWIRWVAFVSYFKSELRQLSDRLRDRSRLMLMRTSGVIQSYKWITQHLHPACRVARVYPVTELPVSRLLRAVNDYDLPIESRYFGVHKRLKFIVKAVDFVTSVIITSILSLPFGLDEVAIYFLAMIFTYCIVIALTIFGEKSAWFYPIIVVSAICAISVGIHFFLRRNVVSKRESKYIKRATSYLNDAAREEDPLDSYRSESKDNRLKPISPTSPRLSNQSSSKPPAYLSNVIVRERLANKPTNQLQYQFESPVEVVNYSDFALPASSQMTKSPKRDVIPPREEFVSRGETIQHPRLLNLEDVGNPKIPKDSVINSLKQSQLSNPEDIDDIYLLNYFPVFREESKNTSEPLQSNSLLSNIEQSLSQTLASRQLSPMQKKHRSTISEPSSPTLLLPPGETVINPSSLITDNDESLQDGFALYLSSLEGRLKPSSSPRFKSDLENKNLSLGPGGRARLLVSATAPLSGGSTLIDRVLEDEPVSGRRRHRNRKPRRGPGAHLYSNPVTNEEKL